MECSSLGYFSFIGSDLKQPYASSATNVGNVKRYIYNVCAVICNCKTLLKWYTVNVINSK